jgi:hypothetical protein
MRRRDRDHTLASVRRRHGPKAAEAVQAFRTATGPLRDHYRARVADYVGELGLELIRRSKRRTDDRRGLAPG